MSGQIFHGGQLGRASRPHGEFRIFVVDHVLKQVLSGRNLVVVEHPDFSAVPDGAPFQEVQRQFQVVGGLVDSLVPAAGGNRDLAALKVGVVNARDVEVGLCGPDGVRQVEQAFSAVEQGFNLVVRGSHLGNGLLAQGVAQSQDLIGVILLSQRESPIALGVVRIHFLLEIHGDLNQFFPGQAVLQI